MHCPTAQSSAFSWLKSRRKYWATARPSASRQARPTRNATVPVPPDSPVVSVSRKSGRRRSPGSSPRQIESAFTSWSPSSGNHSRRTTTGPNGVASSMQLAGGLLKFPSPACGGGEGGGRGGRGGAKRGRRSRRRRGNQRGQLEEAQGDGLPLLPHLQRRANAARAPALAPALRHQIVRRRRHRVRRFSQPRA